MANFCSNCGAHLAESSKFCHSCGSAIKENATPQSNTPQYAPPPVQPVTQYIPVDEMPTKEHLEVFRKCFDICGDCGGIYMIFVIVMGIFALVGKKEYLRSELEDITNFAIAGVIICALVAVVMMLIALGTRLNPAPTKNQISFCLSLLGVSMNTSIGALMTVGIADMFVSRVIGSDSVFILIMAIVGSVICLAADFVIAYIKSRYEEGNIPASQNYTSGNPQQNAAPRLRTTSKLMQANASEKPVNVGRTWKCKCGYENPEHADSCKSCGKYK